MACAHCPLAKRESAKEEGKGSTPAFLNPNDELVSFLLANMKNLRSLSVMSSFMGETLKKRL
jgi:hypothetical protein